jgi:hypothetical protein
VRLLTNTVPYRLVDRWDQPDLAILLLFEVRFQKRGLRRDMEHRAEVFVRVSPSRSNLISSRARVKISNSSLSGSAIGRSDWSCRLSLARSIDCHDPRTGAQRRTYGGPAKSHERPTHSINAQSRSIWRETFLRVLMPVFLITLTYNQITTGRTHSK